MKLYHYVHCPFCLRVRFSLGFLKLKYESIVLAYEDEATPVKLTGKKMLPILLKDDGSAMNESLDIIQFIDQKNLLRNENYLHLQSEIDKLLNEIGANVHSLCMPYWIYTPEFNETNRRYFQKKKEEKRGPFHLLIQNKDQYINALNGILINLEKDLSPFYKSQQLTIVDIMLASHLWGMYIFPEFQFSEKMHQYLQSVKNQCQFDYHGDFWKNA
jgi:glutaredoxin 2